MLCGVISFSSVTVPPVKAPPEHLQQMPAVLTFGRGFDTCQKAGLAAVSATRGLLR